MVGGFHSGIAVVSVTAIRQLSEIQRPSYWFRPIQPITEKSRSELLIGVTLAGRRAFCLE